MLQTGQRWKTAVVQGKPVRNFSECPPAGPSSNTAAPPRTLHMWPTRTQQNHSLTHSVEITTHLRQQAPTPGESRAHNVEMRALRASNGTAGPSLIHQLCSRAVSCSGGSGGAASSAAAAAAAAAGGVCCWNTVRSVWGESLDRSEASRVDSFYNTTVETYAQLPIAALSLQRLLESGRSAALDAGYVMQSAQEVRGGAVSGGWALYAGARIRASVGL